MLRFLRHWYGPSGFSAIPTSDARLAGIALLVLASLAAAPSPAQTAATLAQVRKIYVAPFTGKRGAADTRDEIIDRLKHDPPFTIVASAGESDAVLRGNEQIWITGYISTNPRAPESNRSPIYNGYLSLTLEGGSGQALWSYLVTPGHSLSGSITSGLAAHGAHLLLAAVAQEKGSDTASAPVASPTIIATAPAAASLHGAGGTFPAPLYQAWFQSFHQLHPELTITYTPVGSQQGMERLLAGKVDFAASDIAVSPSGASLQRFATVLGAVVPIYHLPGVDHPLRFTPEILGGIYLGSITHWNDPAIRAINRGVSLPNAPIAVIHRSDGSGTTYAFTDYLARTNSAWKSSPGTGSTIAWPVGTGAAGNDGVATLVQQTPNSVGYVELTYAIQHELSFGSVRNSAGVFLSASLETVAAAAQTAAPVPITSTDSGDAPLSIANAPGKTAYPIATFTWIVLPAPLPARSQAALSQLLQWMLTSGQKQSSALGYAPLPHALASRELQQLAHLK